MNAIYETNKNVLIEFKIPELSRFSKPPQCYVYLFVLRVGKRDHVWIRSHIAHVLEHVGYYDGVPIYRRVK